MPAKLKEGQFIGVPQAKKYLHGSAMTSRMGDFAHNVCGHRIDEIGYVHFDGQVFPCLRLSSGENLIIQCDDEGNGPGVVFCSNSEDILCQTCPA